MQGVEKKKWMVSIDVCLDGASNPLQSDLATITKLSRHCAIYIQLSETMQRFIQCRIRSQLAATKRFQNSTPNATITKLHLFPLDKPWAHKITFVFFNYFGIKFETKLLTFKDNKLWGYSGILRPLKTIPQIKMDERELIFRARTIPQILAQQMDITEKLITEKCKQKDISSCHGYCRNRGDQYQLNIPKSLIRIITFYFKHKEGILIIDDTKQLITKICTPNAVLLADGYCRNYMEQNNADIPCYLIQIILGYFNITLKHLNESLIK